MAPIKKCPALYHDKGGSWQPDVHRRVHFYTALLSRIQELGPSHVTSPLVCFIRPFSGICSPFARQTDPTFPCSAPKSERMPFVPPARFSPRIFNYHFCRIRQMPSFRSRTVSESDSSSLTVTAASTSRTVLRNGGLRRHPSQVRLLKRDQVGGREGG